MIRFSLLYTFVFFGIGLYAQPSVNIHAHNDYKNKMPFWNALENQCSSIEVDLILKEGTLFVAHERATIRKDRTFESLYLDAIQQGLEQGKIKSPFALLIDLKTSAIPTLSKVIECLELYPDLIEASAQGTLTFIISGSRPPSNTYINYPNFIKFDYQSLEPLDAQNLQKVAMISLSFKGVSSWKGRKKLKSTNKKAIVGILEKAHAMGKPFRFWGTPDTELAWKTLDELGVDYINTDKVSTCAEYFGQ